MIPRICRCVRSFFLPAIAKAAKEKDGYNYEANDDAHDDDDGFLLRGDVPAPVTIRAAAGEDHDPPEAAEAAEAARCRGAPGEWCQFW